jgi:integrase/recombinase XerD
LKDKPYDVILYNNPCKMATILENGTSFAFYLPGIAAHDEKLLLLWLYGKSEKTVAAYTRDLGKFYHEIGKSLQYTTLEDLQHFDTSLAHMKPASRARTLAALKSVMSFGAKMEMLPTNVGTMFELPKLEDKLAERIMSEHSVDEILRLETNKRNHAILVLLYYGGLRVSELCNLTWRNLQERDNTGQITVFGKGKETRHILLDTDTWREVWNLRDNAPLDAYVFTSRQSRSLKGKDNRRLDESRIHQIVRTAANRAGVSVDHVSPHWMRHAHATHALEAGASITLVKNTLGHKSIETTARYTHVRPNDSSAIVLRKKRKKE